MIWKTTEWERAFGEEGVCGVRKRKTGRVCAHDGRGGGAAEEWVDVKRVESVAGLWIVPVTTIILWAVVVVVVVVVVVL